MRARGAVSASAVVVGVLRILPAPKVDVGMLCLYDVGVCW